MDPQPEDGRLMRKAKEAPFMVIGLAGLLGVLGYSIYGFKNRKTSTSLYVVQTRVYAQGSVVICCTLGIAYQMFKDHLLPKYNSTDDAKK